MHYTNLGETDLNASSDLSRVRGRARPTNVRWGVIALLFFATTINYLDRTNLSVALPILAKTFSWTPAAMGAISSAFAITYALAQMPVGAFIDRIGTRLTYIWSLIVWSLASMATALGNGFASIYVFLALSFLTICEFGVMFSNGSAWAATSELAPLGRSASLAGTQNFGGNVGAFLAPSVTGLLVQMTSSFVSALVVAGLLAVAGALLYYILLPSRPLRGDAAPRASIVEGSAHLAS